MRVVPPRVLDALAVLLAAEALEPFAAERQTGVDELDMRAFPERVRHDRLVLVRHDGAGRVDNVTASLGRVDRAEEELLLQVREEHKVALSLSGVEVS